MKIFYYIATVILTILVSIVSVFFIITEWWLLFIPRYKRYKMSDPFLIIPWTIVLNTLTGLRVKVLNKQYVDKKRTTLYICNHQSWIDIPTLLSSTHASALSKKEVKYIPFIGILTIYGGAFFFDRDEKKSRLGIIKEVIDMLKKGYSLCVFPEGTRSFDGNLLEPNITLIKLCYKLNVCVVPAAIEGSRNALQKGNYYMKFFQKVVLKYAEPLYPKDFKNDEEFAKACWGKVTETHTEIKTTYFNK
ncbi:MAG: hypothetical protein A2086_15880 [Spirochaetes bacterium GWD1_27_9]|nr:MAG: hypothetical protein A2Z98_11150 [Spirochaetes bacterium GWB1_27_13]OHD24813.1 MAG: hypothetical protein A2Y34_08260 [Spirochaetes bacterium GWC1_27_15]OHD42858.1 MAG: hypothetical protein A2086_15880 [Spirochaetes bacterium GWD1_27_9]